MTSSDYKKLSGSGRRFDGARFIGGVSKRTRLYLGPDHLLAVETAGFTEDYKRFYYRDIQALIVKETPRRSVWGLVLGILTVLELVGAVAIGAAAAYVVFGSLVFITLTLFVVNQVMGPTCDTFLKTAVQVEPLPSLYRVKSAGESFQPSQTQNCRGATRVLDRGRAFHLGGLVCPRR